MVITPKLIIRVHQECRQAQLKTDEELKRLRDEMPRELESIKTEIMTEVDTKIAIRRSGSSASLDDGSHSRSESPQIRSRNNSFSNPPGGVLAWHFTRACTDARAGVPPTGPSHPPPQMPQSMYTAQQYAQLPSAPPRKTAPSPSPSIPLPQQQIQMQHQQQVAQAHQSSKSVSCIYHVVYEIHTLGSTAQRLKRRVQQAPPVNIASSRSMPYVTHCWNCANMAPAHVLGSLHVDAGTGAENKHADAVCCIMHLLNRRILSRH